MNEGTATFNVSRGFDTISSRMWNVQRDNDPLKSNTKSNTDDATTK